MNNLVDWDLAVTLGSRIAGPGPDVSSEEAGAAVVELRGHADASTALVREFTGLDAPDGTAPDGPDVPLSELPIPDSLQGLASAVGITDVGQLLDLAVANGIMSQEDADNLRSGIAAGALANGLAQGQ